MISLKLIFQTIAGVGAAAACVSGSVYGMTKTPANSLFPATNSSYYLVSATKKTEHEAQKPMLTSSEPDSKPLSPPRTEEERKEFFIKQMESLNQKNYTCKFAKNERDDSCNLFYIKENQNTGTIDLQKIKDFIKNGEKTTNEIYKTPSNSSFKGIKFFLLRVSSDKKKIIKTDGNSTIDLLTLATGVHNKEKSYGTLTVHAEITETKAEGKVNLLIGKVAELFLPPASEQKLDLWTAVADTESSSVSTDTLPKGTEFNISNPVFVYPTTDSNVSDLIIIN